MHEAHKHGICSHAYAIRKTMKGTYLIVIILSVPEIQNKSQIHLSNPGQHF